MAGQHDHFDPDVLGADFGQCFNFDDSGRVTRVAIFMADVTGERRMARQIMSKDRDEAVRRFHPWVFSGAIHKVEGTPEDGDIVEVHDS